LGVLEKVVVGGPFSRSARFSKSSNHPACAKRSSFGLAIDRNGRSPSDTLDTMASSKQVVPERRHYGDHQPYPDPPARSVLR
jgi:hypothetical protein